MHQWGSRSSKTQNAHIGFRESGIFWGTFFFCQSQKIRSSARSTVEPGNCLVVRQEEKEAASVKCGRALRILDSSAGLHGNACGVVCDW